ncbi:MAG: glutamate--tRNA ligase [Caldiserica bacterium]|nr:MAG: glutamate--tRNA ligase [Caldisericota bacterium]
MVRVRFAPSPTGYLHVGGARTALYNYLFARKNSGKFVLRIEDTDEVRSTFESVKQIISSLTFLGIEWDEGPFLDKQMVNGKWQMVIDEKGDYGPYFQSKRKEMGIYEKYALKLLKEDKAYYCFCSKEEIEERKKKKSITHYDGYCRNLSKEEIEKKLKEGRKPAVRFKVDFEKDVSFNDLIRGEITFNTKFIEDFVILKSSGYPTYNFACVIDDYLMKITHVIRGDDHISNTPRQILLYEALGFEKPYFAHLPMILGEDKKRLSKRHGAVSIEEFKRNGYLPEALLNYLALLGWGTEDSKQIFSLSEMIEEFDLKRCSKSKAVFDYGKLIWLNGYYIRKKSPEEIFKLSFDFIKEYGIDGEIERIKKAIELEKEKIKLLKDVPYLISFFFKDDIEIEEDVKKKIKNFKNVEKNLKNLIELFKGIDFKRDEIERVLREYAEKEGIKTKEIFHPLRFSVSGRTKGPSLFEMLELLGKEKVIKRIERFLEWLKKQE